MTESDYDVTISMTFRISFNANDTGLMLVLIITIFEFKELKSDKTIYVELVRDLAKECDFTISVTCRSYSNANDAISMLVSILPYSRLRNSKMRKEMMYHSRVT